MTNATENSLPVAIREMTADDLDAVLTLERQIFTDDWSRQAFQEALDDDTWGLLLAEHGGDMIGYACYVIIDIKAHLTNIAVEPTHRRKSVAKALLDRILQTVTQRNCEYILLEVRPSNQAAIAFYEKHGFEKGHQRPGYYRNAVEDALVMVRHLARYEQED